MAMKFCISLVKGLKLKVRKSWGANSCVCGSFMGKTGRGDLFSLPILNRVKKETFKTKQFQDF